MQTLQKIDLAISSIFNELTFYSGLSFAITRQSFPKRLGEDYSMIQLLECKVDDIGINNESQTIILYSSKLSSLGSPKVSIEVLNQLAENIKKMNVDLLRFFNITLGKKRELVHEFDAKIVKMFAYMLTKYNSEQS